MKKKFAIFITALILALCSASLTACTDKYEDYLGTYECIYITSNGTSILGNYEYYSLELKKGRNLHSKFKLSIAPYTSGETDSKFDIDGELFTETVGVLKNEYKYIDGVIILEYEVSGLKLVAKFERSAV